MAEIVNISYIGSGTESQVYTPKDDALITNSFIFTQFGDPNDSIEYFIYDSVGNLLEKVYNATGYKPDSTVNPTTELYSSIALDPKKDLESRGYNRGTLEIQYNFLRNLFNSAYGKFYWIKEVSPSRTEIKLASQDISNTDILNGFNQYQAYVAGLNYYNDFYLNFGNNQHVIAVNVAYVTDDAGSYLLIKLYEPLPSDFDVKDQLWISEKIAESSRYNVTIDVQATQVTEQNVLRGPNYNVNLNQQVAQTTPYYSYQSLSSTAISGSFQKMMSYYQDKALEINVDYTDFSNFVHFSSITSRIQNFAQKVTNIESYTSASSAQLLISGGISNPVVSSSYVLLQKQIDDIITNFDTYEYYLYFSSGSYTWPKSGSTQPYTLYSVNSPQAINWLSGMVASASFYDATNKDLLTNVIPQYIQDDSTNEPYITFVNMIGQHFDNIWIYYKDVTNRFNATNNPETGISPDLVADALMALGSTLYTNSNISDNLYYSLFGINADGSLLPPTGSEKITSYVTSSLTTLSPKAIQSEIYKRIYHNIPYLYKTKGTRNSIDAIVNIFGIPKSILTINEFGGYDRSLVTGVDSIYNTKISGSTSVAEISSSLLHPDVTLQYYSTQKRLNSKNLEFGFSPADSINSTISSSVGYINIDQLIGDPGAQYSASYPSLVAYQNSFFTGSQVHDIYEYIRLLKYYDNSIFKMVKDYVPARSSLSTGMIVKSHVLERNKYERHEPEMDNSMNYSQSIETVTISATDAPEIPYSTAYNSKSQYTVTSPYISTASTNVYGPVSMSNTYAWEKYTGEFGGSEIEMVTDEFSQLERSSITFPWTSSVASTQLMFTFYNEGALVNNFTKTQPSKEFVSAKYSYGIDTPINFANIVSQSSCQSCDRISCMNYELTSFTGSTLYYTYQECGGETQYLSLSPTSSAYFCARPETFRFTDGFYLTIQTIPTSSCILQPISSCGSTFANRSACNKITINAIDPFVGNYVKCNGDYRSITLTSDESYTDCVRFGTLNVVTGENYTVEDQGLCYNTCVTTQVTNLNATRTLPISYKDCYGIDKSLTIPASTGQNLGCIQSGSVQISRFAISPSYTISDSGPCFKDCILYKIINTEAIFSASPREISYYYTDCFGNATTASVPVNSFNYFCATSGSFSIASPGGGGLAYYFSTSSLGYCNPSTKPCTTLTQVLYGPGRYGYSYQKCNGENVLYERISDETTADDIYDCIKLNTLSTFGSITNVYTGSYCGYYTYLTEYTGSRDYADIQDYNYYRTSTVNSKYAGAKYTDNKTILTTWSFGAIYEPRDYYVDYTGLFTTVETSSYFPTEMVLKLPYLANISGGLQELNLQNENWVYFQNIYKPGSMVTLKQFNATQYSNQKYLDKSYKVLESGYSYQPYYYRSSGSVSECFDTDVAETYSTSGSTYVKKQFLPGNAVISTSPLPPYTGNQNSLYKYFPTVPFSGSDTISGTSGPTSGFWEINLWSSGSYGDTYFGNRSLLTSYVSGTIPTFVNPATDNLFDYGRFKAGEYYTTSFNGYYNFSGVFVFKKIDTLGTESGSFTLDIINGGSGSISSIYSAGFVDGQILATKTVNVPGSPADWGTPGYEINLQTTQYLPSGSKIFFRLKTNYKGVSAGNTDTYGIFIEQGANIIANAVTMDATLCRSLSISSNDLFDSGSLTTSSLSLKTNTNNFFTSASTFNPSYSDYYNSSSVLYGEFGDINYTMQPEVGDYIYLYYDGRTILPTSTIGNLKALRFRIINIDTDPVIGTQRFNVSPNIPDYITSGVLNSYIKAVFAKRVPDETTMILQGKKNPGKTSYGFAIPENINPQITKNINTLQSTIQSQILNF